MLTLRIATFALAFALSSPAQARPHPAPRAPAPASAPARAEQEALRELRSSDSAEAERLLAWFQFRTNEGVSLLLNRVEEASRGDAIDDAGVAAFWNLVDRADSPDLREETKDRAARLIQDLAAAPGPLRAHAALALFTPGPHVAETWSEALALLRAHGILRGREWTGRALGHRVPALAPRFAAKRAVHARYEEALLRVADAGVQALAGNTTSDATPEFPADSLAAGLEAYRFANRLPEPLFQSFLRRALLARESFTEGSAPAAPAFTATLPKMQWSFNDEIEFGRCGAQRTSLSGTDVSNQSPNYGMCPNQASAEAVVQVQALATKTAGPDEATYIARIHSLAYGGFRKKHSENTRSQANYNLDGDATIPVCRSPLRCSPLLSFSWQGSTPANNEDQVTSTTVTISTADGSWSQELHPGEVVRVSRAEQELKVHVHIQRWNRHMGYCCARGAFEHAFDLRVQDALGLQSSTPVPPRGFVGDLLAAALYRGNQNAAPLSEIGPTGAVDPDQGADPYFRTPPPTLFSALATRVPAPGGAFASRYETHYGRIYLAKLLLQHTMSLGLKIDETQAIGLLANDLALSAKQSFAGDVEVARREVRGNLESLRCRELLDEIIPVLMDEKVYSPSLQKRVDSTLAVARHAESSAGAEIGPAASDELETRLGALEAALRLRRDLVRLEREWIGKADLLETETARLKGL